MKFSKIDAEMFPKLISRKLCVEFCGWKIRASILGSESTLNSGAASTLTKRLYFSGIFLLLKRLKFTAKISSLDSRF
jgi:hypothetical protein